MQGLGRILVTGAGGFIGRQAVLALLKRGFEVHAHRLTLPRETGRLYQWHSGDLHDFEHLRVLLKVIRPTHLLHLAWYTSHGDYWHSDENFRWVNSSLELLRQFQFNGGMRFIGVGSCAEYTWSAELLDEQASECTPATVYGQAKWNLRGMVDSIALDGDLSTAWGRVFLAFGPGEQPERFVPSVIRSLQEGRPVHCTHGEQIRDYLHCQDVGDALAALAASEVQGPVNIGAGKGIAIKEIACILAEAAGRPELLRLGVLPARADDPPRIVASIRRLAQEVGWSPRLPLAERLLEYADWCQVQRLETVRQ